MVWRAWYTELTNDSHSSCRIQAVQEVGKAREGGAAAVSTVEVWVVEGAARLGEVSD